MLRRKTLSKISAGLGMAAVAAVSALGVGSSVSNTADAATTPTISSMSNYPFPNSSSFKTNISQAPLDPQSAQKTVAFINSFKDLYGGIAAFNVWNYNNAVYVVNPDTPRYVINFNDCQKKGYTPSGWYGETGQFGTVPIPDSAVPAAGTDGEMTIYSPSEDRIWEFWVTKRDAATNTWSACWGGSVKNASTNTSGAFTANWGVSASGLVSAGEMISLADVRRGYIDHAVALAIPKPARGVISYPAIRTDGYSTDPLALAEGQRLRLDPSINVDALNLTPMAKMVAKAAQTYGFIVTDAAGTAAVVTESGQAEKLATGVDPWVAILGKTPAYNVMKNFPWDKTQVIQKDFGKPALAISTSVSVTAPTTVKSTSTTKPTSVTTSAPVTTSVKSVTTSSVATTKPVSTVTLKSLAVTDGHLRSVTDGHLRSVTAGHLR